MNRVKARKKNVKAAQRTSKRERERNCMEGAVIL
jgi:hypothetical protein